MRSLALALLVACGGDAPVDPSSDTAETTTAWPTSPTGPADTGPGADTWDSFAGAFFADYCVKCHQEAPKDWRNYDEVLPYAEAIRCGVSSEPLDDCGPSPAPGQFPAGPGPFPSENERDRLVAWIDAGMPE